MKIGTIDFSIEARRERALERISRATESIVIKCVYDWEPTGVRIEAIRNAMDREVKVTLLCCPDKIDDPKWKTMVNQLEQGYPNLFSLIPTNMDPKLHIWLIDNLEWHIEECIEGNTVKSMHGKKEEMLKSVQKYIKKISMT